MLLESDVTETVMPWNFVMEVCHNLSPALIQRFSKCASVCLSDCLSVCD